jgi:hypothetical protein
MVDLARSEVSEDLVHPADHRIKGGRVTPTEVLAWVVFLA